MADEVIVKTGVIFGFFPLQLILVSPHLRLHEPYQHPTLSVQLPHLVAIIVIKMLHNHQMGQLKMNIMSLNMNVYLNPHLDISRDIDITLIEH